MSVTSYLSENEAENLQNGDVHLVKIPDFEMEYLETIWRIEVGDGSFFRTSHALSFEPNFFFDRRFPLKPGVTGVSIDYEHIGFAGPNLWVLLHQLFPDFFNKFSVSDDLKIGIILPPF